MREKVLAVVGLPLAGAAAGYFYLIGVLRPVSPAVACLMVQRDVWRCTPTRSSSRSRSSSWPER